MSIFSYENLSFLEQEQDELRNKEKRLNNLKKAKSDFSFFCKTYLSEAFNVESAPYQLALSRTISKRFLTKKDKKLLINTVRLDSKEFIKETKSIDGLLDIEPRDHGKTTRNTQALPLWIALAHEKTFILVCSATKTIAEDMMEATKSVIEDSDELLRDFGELKTKKSSWSKRKISLVNGSSIVAVGADQSLRGIKDKFQRPTHIICDDLLKDEAVESKTQRDKIYKWFKRVILNLGKDALTAVVNTIIHPDDLPSRLLDEIKQNQLTNWLGFKFSALDPKGNPIWSARWSKEDIEDKRKKLGAHIFATEWENNPAPNDAKIFQEEWFEYFSLHDLDLRDCTIKMAVDPATGKENGCDSALAVVAKNKLTGIYYTLFANGYKESDLVLARRICDLYRLHRPIEILIEDIAFQAIYKKEVVREGSNQGLHLPIKGFRGGNKNVRIKKLAPLIENGALVFQKNQKKLLEQLTEYPRGLIDIPDALEMAVSAFETTEYIGAHVLPKSRAKDPVSQILQNASDFTSKYKFRGY